MNRLLLLCLTLGLVAIVSCYSGHRGYSHGSSGLNHHHYYDHVINNVHHHHDDDHDDHHGEKKERKYRFHIGDSNLGAYAYLDGNGLLRGIYIDVILSVCKRAGKKCHYMLDDFNRCWDAKGENEKPGDGLLYEAYDGCVGMLKTPERTNSFAFTKAFTPSPGPRMFFKTGKIPDDPTNIEGKKIGFVHAWALNTKCLARSGSFKGQYQPSFYDTNGALMKAVASGEIDAGVSASAFAPADELEGVEYGGPVFKCGISGLSVMTHYGNELLGWWDDAMDSLVKEYGWKGLCEKAKKEHGDHGEVFCLG